LVEEKVEAKQLKALLSLVEVDLLLSRLHCHCRDVLHLGHYVLLEVNIFLSCNWILLYVFLEISKTQLVAILVFAIVWVRLLYGIVGQMDEVVVQA
jgi:hypothetical protein